VRVHRRKKTSRLRRVPQPVALLRHEHVRVIKARRRAIDAAELLDGLDAFADVSATGPSTSDAGSCSRSASVRPLRAGEREGSQLTETQADPIGRRGAIPSDAFRQIGRADNLVKVDAGAVCGDRADPSLGGVHDSKAFRVSGSTESGSRRYRS
jgi:hypothetical protein